VPRKHYLFTSESVSEGHPDKVCDRISDEIVDMYFELAPKHGMDPRQVRVACETLCTTNRVVIAGETRGPAEITKDMVTERARQAIKDIGYEQDGFHCSPPISRRGWTRPETRTKARATRASCSAMPAARRPN
jgi:S-adenosylmethionine synthetase